MKTKKALLLLSSLALTISACNDYHGDYPLVHNGDSLILLEENSITDYLFSSTYQTITNLIESNEIFLFYVSSSKCSSCETFNETALLPYLKNSKQAIYYIDVYAQAGDYYNLCLNYPDYFLTVVATPHLYLVNGQSGCESLSNNYFETEFMFTKYMQRNFYDTNLYLFTSYANLISCIKRNECTPVFIYDRSSNEQAAFYTENLRSLLYEANNDVYVVDYAFLSEEDRTTINTLLGCEENIDTLYGLIFTKAGTIDYKGDLLKDSSALTKMIEYL